MKVADLEKVTAEIDAALDMIAKKYGIMSMNRSAARFARDPENKNKIVNFKFSVDVQCDNTIAKEHFKMYGLPEDSIGKTFVFKSRTYTITGVAPKKDYSIVCTTPSSDKESLFKPRDVKQMLGIINTTVSSHNGLPANTLIKRNLDDLLAEEAKQDMAPGLKSRFMNLAIQLSPENLHMDGEATKSQVAGRKGALMSQWKKLETLAGREVQFSEFGI